MMKKRGSGYYNSLLNSTVKFFVLSTLFLWLATRSKPVRAQQNTARFPGKVFISAELSTISEKWSRIWSSTRDKFLRKSSFPSITNYCYGLQFDIKNNNVHVFLCILLAGDVATNPGPTRKNSHQQNGSQSFFARCKPVAGSQFLGGHS